MHYDKPCNWDAWIRSVHLHQAILMSLKTHQTDEQMQGTPSTMNVYLPTPLTTPSPTPIKINKVYTIPTQQNPKTQKDNEQQQGLCHLSKGQGHIQHYCPKKVINMLASIMHMKAAMVGPLVADQGLKHPHFPTTTKDKVLHYLRRQTPKTQNKLVAAI